MGASTEIPRISGTGLGLRFKAWRGAFGGPEWAVAMSDLGNTGQGDDRMPFRLAFAW